MHERREKKHSGSESSVKGITKSIFFGRHLEGPDFKPTGSPFIWVSSLPDKEGKVTGFKLIPWDDPAWFSVMDKGTTRALLEHIIEQYSVDNGIQGALDLLVQSGKEVNSDKPLQMLVSNISYDNYKGRIAIGKIHSGTIKNGQDVAHINREGVIKKCKITSLSTFKGLGKVEEAEALAGDIVAVTGILDVNIGETIADPITPIALPLLDIEEPTVKMVFMVNNSPFGGKEGEFKTSSQIKARLYKELDTDVALKVEDNVDGTWTVYGRGELHLAILIERIRREGYEFQVSRPHVVNKVIDGKVNTPYEKVYIEVPEAYSGVVIQKMGQRHAKMDNLETTEGITYLEFTIATKELIGFRSEFITDTKGLGIMNAAFFEFLPDDGFTRERERGSLVAYESGETRLYGMTQVQDQGELFIGPAVKVYKGQVVGQHSRTGDLRINVCKEKKLSNMRSKGEGTMEHFNTPREMGLEDALEYIDDTELVEVTPKSIRIRKVILDEVEARKAAKLAKNK